MHLNEVASQLAQSVHDYVTALNTFHGYKVYRNQPNPITDTVVDLVTDRDGVLRHHITNEELDQLRSEPILDRIPARLPLLDLVGDWYNETVLPTLANEDNGKYPIGCTVTVHFHSGESTAITVDTVTITIEMFAVINRANLMAELLDTDTLKTLLDPFDDIPDFTNLKYRAVREMPNGGLMVVGSVIAPFPLVSPLEFRKYAVLAVAPYLKATQEMYPDAIDTYHAGAGANFPAVVHVDYTDTATNTAVCEVIHFVRQDI